MKLHIALFLLFALVVPSFTQEDSEAIAEGMANYWKRKASEERLIKHRNRELGRQRRRNAMRSAIKNGKFVPPWIRYKDGNGEATTGENTEVPNEDGQKEIELDDIKLWSAMDLDKDGKLTITEFEQFASSPSARRFVSGMKQSKAVEAWATKMNIDVDKAKQAMALGAQAQAQANFRAAQQQRAVQLNAQARANQRRHAQAAQQQSYFANLGKRYYNQFRHSRRDEL